MLSRPFQGCYMLFEFVRISAECLPMYLVILAFLGNVFYVCGFSRLRG